MVDSFIIVEPILLITRERNFNRTGEQQNDMIQIVVWHLTSVQKKDVMFPKCKWKGKYITLQYRNTVVNNNDIYHSHHHIKKLTEKKNQVPCITRIPELLLVLHWRKSDTVLWFFKAMFLTPSTTILSPWNSMQ